MITIGHTHRLKITSPDLFYKKSLRHLINTYHQEKVNHCAKEIKIWVSDDRDIIHNIDELASSVRALEFCLIFCSTSLKKALGFIEKSHLHVIAIDKKSTIEEINDVLDTITHRIHNLSIGELLYKMHYSPGRLTKNEKFIISLFSQGIGINDIATIMNLSEKTIYAHKRNAMLRIGTRKINEVLLICHILQI